MAKARTELERAAGLLILAVQKEWTEEMGESGALASEEVMHNCHLLLGAAKSGCISEELQGRSITEYLGPAWVHHHPKVEAYIRAFEARLAVF